MQIFRLKGINWWLLASAIGMNFIWSSVMLLMGMYFLSGDNTQTNMLQFGMLLACLGLPFLIAWIISAMAGDGFQLSYGLFGSLGAAVPILFVIGQAGMLGIIMGLMTVMGGLNGGMLALRRARRK